MDVETVPLSERLTPLQHVWTVLSALGACLGFAWVEVDHLFALTVVGCGNSRRESEPDRREKGTARGLPHRARPVRNCPTLTISHG